MNIWPLLRWPAAGEADDVLHRGILAHDFDEVVELLLHGLEGNALVGLDGAVQPPVSCCGKNPLGMTT
jgi:hypothetical protein